MCGIVGYVGRSDATPILLDGLRRQEYRGYDSAGLAVVKDDRVQVRKCAGRIASLAQLVSEKPISGSYGISHTRWATHGKVTDGNAHPHFDATGKIALVHNGVIENYQALREQLIQNGDTNFRSDTDTEVLAHLIGNLYRQLNGQDSKARLINAVRTALKQVIGTYGIALVHADIPDFIVGARRGSPLVLGIGKDENFLASDVNAIVAYTRDAIYLNDFDVVAIERDKFEISSVDGAIGQRTVSKVEFTADDIKKGDYPHYMLKEIFEQPNSTRDAMRGRLSLEECTAKLGGLNMTAAQLREVARVMLTGCGTAMHAAMVGEYLIEQLANLPTDVEYASEFRHRNTPMTEDTLVFAISQSGETADTLGALRESRRKGYRTLGICNNVASTIARESDGGVYMHAGPEVGVAATKSFTSQLTILTLIGLLLGQLLREQAVAMNELVLGFFLAQARGDVVRDLEVDQRVVEGIPLLRGLWESALGGIDYEFDVGIDRVVRLADHRTYKDLHLPGALHDVLVHIQEAVAVALQDLVEVATKLAREPIGILLQQEGARGVEPLQVGFHDTTLQRVV